MRLLLYLLAGLLTGVAQAGCPLGYTHLYGEKCIKYYADLKYHREARQTCLADGADLASIHSEEENNILYANMPKDSYHWIGLSCDPRVQTFEWSDGTPFDYSNYEYSVCNGTFDTETWIVMHFKSSLWVLNGAALQFHYICMAENEESKCDDGYEYSDELSICLKVYTSPASWTQAESTCQDDRAHLVSVHDRAMNLYVRRLALSNYLTKSVLIGLHVGSDNVVGWSDGTDLDYQNYATGMPNQIFGACTALTIDEMSGEWMSVLCDDRLRLPFICQMPANVIAKCPSSSVFVGQGDIYSPGYPASKTLDLNCEYLIASSNATVAVNFVELVLIQDDKITLFDGEERDVIVAVLNASSTITDVPYRTRNGNIMLLIWTTSTVHTGSRRWHLQYA